MKNPEEIKTAICALYDGEATAEQKQLAEMAISESKEYKDYYEELAKLSSSLKAWQDEAPSPDFEHKLKSMLKREGNMMKTIAEKMNPKMGAGILVFGLICFIAGPLVQEYQQYETQKFEGTQAVQMEPAILIDKKVGPPKTDVLAVSKRDPFVQKVKEKPVPVKVKAIMKSEAAVMMSQANVASGGMAMEVADYAAPQAMRRDARVASLSMDSMSSAPMMLREERIIDRPYPLPVPYPVPPVQTGESNTEDYASLVENPFLQASENPLSTFSIDVDTASYSNVRRFLNSDQMPQKDAVRIEEMINYFNYDYAQPKEGEPFSITTEVGKAPWNKDNDVVLIGLQGKQLSQENLPESNLVFLIDVSGSMNNANKLPLLKKAFKRMLAQLGETERVAIVTYAGSSGLALESTPASEKDKIMQALDRLNAGGSTAGGQGIQLAYKVAKENFIEGGNNRVILATDGDFNVGVSSDGELTRLIEEKREEGVFLTVLGFGTGNYKDNKMEQIANKGNGNYYYIDTFKEAQKVLVQELGSTLFTIAKDVKIQIEFNPAKVKAYRLIGYENRMLAKEDFNDDTKDAGELGAGHTVTALYEIVPADSKENFGQVDELKYQTTDVVESDELLTVKFRYKEPGGKTSKLIEKVLKDSKPSASLVNSDNFRLASAVAEWGMLLRDSKHKAQSSYVHALQVVKEVTGKDEWGYREELATLIEKSKSLDSSGGIQFKN